MNDRDTLISELRDVTYEMAGEPDLAGERFAGLMRRRRQLIEVLRGGGFDLADERIRSIVGEGASILMRAQARRDALRLEAANLQQVAALVGGIKSMLGQRKGGVDLSA